MKKHYRVTYLYIFGLISVLLLYTACSDGDSVFGNNGRNVSNTNYSATQAFSQNVAVNNQTAFVLEGINGTIIVMNGDDQLVKIWGERRVESESTSDAEEWLADLTLQVEDRSNEVFVKTIQPIDTYGRNLIVNYNVEIPASWSATIDNINGNVQLDSINGGVDLNLVNGRVVLNDLFCNVKVNLTNGGIESRLKLPEEGAVYMDLVNGSIDLNIPTNTSAQVQAAVTNGSLQTNNLVFQSLSSSARSLNGTLSSGQGTIDLTTVNGTITITGYE